jgi:DNA polymerase-3 subunit gamma/tau
MSSIADHDTATALALMNRCYADGKDMGALLDELSCLTRDLMIMKTAPKEGISMLSGVASDREVLALAERFSGGELVRMMNLIRQTVSGFTRGGSRRMEAELCIVSLCQPELELDMESLNARLTRMEDQLRSGSVSVKTVKQELPKQELPKAEPVPVQNTEPMVEQPKPVAEDVPVGFWTDLCADLRRELKPPALGFFAPNGPIRYTVHDDTLTLTCDTEFTMSAPLAGAGRMSPAGRAAKATIPRRRL